MMLSNIENGFVINPYCDLMPDFKICPFNNQDLYINKVLPQSDSIDHYLAGAHSNRYVYYLQNARQAIGQALAKLELKRDDVVTILTTSGNLYIAEGVTREIDKFCKWSRVFEPNTRAILVNHEFGFPYKDVEKLRRYNLPIIEDCTYAFFTTNPRNTVGRIGDFVVYSFPETFPVQFGGLLVSKEKIHTGETQLLDLASVKYLKKVLSHYVRQKEKIIAKRTRNYLFLKKQLLQLGLEERFELDTGCVPGVYLFKKMDYQFDLLQLKEHMYRHGIQSNVFEGEETFFIPVHQRLERDDMLYFKEVIAAFIRNPLTSFI